MSAKDFNSTDLALVFHDVSVASLIPPIPLLSNISGFVKKGGITAVFGASASGKSLLLQALAGRIQSLSITGEVYLNGMKINPESTQNAISYVPQTTMLLGDLTSKEMIYNAAAMKSKAPVGVTRLRVDKILQDFAIDHVQDTFIGTVFRAGLSGGQKRRVDVAVELATAPPVALLDEPSSGLDGSIAYDVLHAIKKSAQSQNLAVMLSIHQPNSRILGLFDHILVLGGGGMAFFGTVQESIAHFTRIGYEPPVGVTPTDYYLKATDLNFSQSKYDFMGAFNSSEKYFDLLDLIECVQRRGQIEQLMKTMDVTNKNNNTQGEDCGSGAVAATAEAAVHPEADVSKALSNSSLSEPASFWLRLYILIKRDFTLALRDPTLYYLQVVLVLMFGFLIGAVFFNLNYRIDESLNYVPAALLWMVMMNMYIPVFKVYHLMKNDARFEHEHANNTYTVLQAWTAELFTVMVLLAFYIPGAAVAYFMAGLPGKAFPFCMLVFWMSALSSESMLTLICKFYKDISAAVVTSQLFLVLLTAFGAGLFIRWEDTPDYWQWLQALSIFNHASRAAMLSVMRKLTYECKTTAIPLPFDDDTVAAYAVPVFVNICFDSLGEQYNCESGSLTGGGKCDVSGSEVLAVTQGVNGGESYWDSFGYLTALFLAFRLLSLFFMYMPVEKVMFFLQKRIHNPHILAELMTSHLKIEKLEQRVKRLVKQKNVPNFEGEANNIRRCTKQEAKAADDEEFDSSAVVVAADEETGLISKPVQGQNDSKSSSGSDLRLAWKDLDLVLKKGGKKLIDSVSGSVRAGRVLALMGPSGAGKTTLLNALANRAPYANVTGAVTFGGQPLTSKDLMYVPQFDEAKGYTTVVEQIQLVGLMKCRDQQGMKQRLVKLMQILGLFDKANTYCKDLSGGELKRLSVGMGMISNPKVIFLDEPTTGLDSTAAFYLVQFLVDLARDMNLPAIMTIHQPAAIVFNMLQDLYLLEGGRLAYFGPITAAAPYFLSIGHVCPGEVNPADFYLDLIYKAPDEDTRAAASVRSSGKLTAADCNEWRVIYYQSMLGVSMTAQLQREEDEEQAKEPVAQQYDEPSAAVRFYYLTLFYFHYFFVNPGYYMYRGAYLVMCAVYIGTLYLNLDTNTDELIQYSGSVFFSIWATLFAAVGSTGLVASDRRQTFEQIKNGIVTPSLYCAATFFASLPYNAVCAVLFQSIFQWVSNVSPDGRTFIYGIILTMGHLTMMEAIMTIIVEIVKDAMLSVTAAMLVLGGLFLLPGFFIQVSDMPVWISWMSYVVPTKYTFDGYIYMVFHNQEFEGPGGVKIGGKDILDDVFNNTDTNAWGMIGVLIAYIIGFRLLHYVLFLHASWPFLSTASK